MQSIFNPNTPGGHYAPQRFTQYFCKARSNRHDVSFHMIRAKLLVGPYCPLPSKNMTKNTPGVYRVDKEILTDDFTKIVLTSILQYYMKMYCRCIWNNVWNQFMNGNKYIIIHTILYIVCMCMCQRVVSYLTQLVA